MQEHQEKGMTVAKTLSRRIRRRSGSRQDGSEWIRTGHQREEIMKRTMIPASINLIIATSSLLLLTQCSSVVQPEDDTQAVSELSLQEAQPVPRGSGNLTDQEKDDLLFMREEEKLARDMYNFLAGKWELAIFERIALSEQRHMDALGGLIDKHKMTDIDPVLIQPAPGLFVNEKIQALYDELEAKGVLSETDALEVGVMVEEIDIEDLEHFLCRVDNQDLINVYQNILDGSYRHLESFESMLP